MTLAVTILTFFTMSGVLPQKAPPTGKRVRHLPPNAKVMKTRGKPVKTPPCVHKTNPPEVLRLARYEAHITIARKHFNLTRKVVFFPSTAWKKRCNHFLKVGFPLTESVPSGKQDIFYFSSPPARRSPLTIERFHREHFKDGSTLPVQGFYGAAMSIPPLGGNPADQSLIFTLEQLSLPLPPEGADKLRTIGLALSQFNNFALMPDFVFHVRMELSEPWKFQGSTLPDAKRLENRFSWEFKKLPGRDIQLIFSDFTIVDKPPEQKKDPVEPPTFILLITISVMAVVSGGVLFFLYRRKNKKSAT
ncbi:hypothetical protein KKF84_00880 [Myxococcota bacterium]|nr:hypothetical protein [Myxococcota bacterium]